MQLVVRDEIRLELAQADTVRDANNVKIGKTEFGGGLIHLDAGPFSKEI